MASNLLTLMFGTSDYELGRGKRYIKRDGREIVGHRKDMDWGANKDLKHSNGHL